MTKLPRNTLVDTLGKAEGIPADARKLMKAIYATSPMAQRFCGGPYPIMTLKEFIDSAERLRRLGLLVIEYESDDTEEVAAFCIRLSDEAMLGMAVPEGSA